MAANTIEGYAVIGPAFIGKKQIVYGVGQYPDQAWRDAAETHTNGRLDAREMCAQYRGFQCLKAQITVRWAKPEAAK